MAGAAAKARALEAQVVAQDVEQRRRGVRFDLVRLPVDPQGNALAQALPLRASLTRGITCSAMSCIERRASRASTQSWQG